LIHANEFANGIGNNFIHINSYSCFSVDAHGW
jgi:hypothetical protein